MGVCVKKCPRAENGDRVTGHDPKDKSKMECMDEKDFLEYTDAGDHGFSDFESLTPINAYRFGVCNYKYRTMVVGNRCYFEDRDVAEMHPYKLPTSKAVIYGQSIFSARLFIIFACIAGSTLTVTFYLYSVQTPVVFADGGWGARTMQGGEAIAIRTVWAMIWASGTAMLCVGSHLWYRAAYYEELAVNPRSETEVSLTVECVSGCGGAGQGSPAEARLCGELCWRWVRSGGQRL